MCALLGRHLLMSMVELHRIMLRDERRNEAYKKAIFATVKPGDTVIDLGAGTGVLSMWCAQAGAKRVHAIEAADVSELGEALVKDNKLEKVVKFWHMPSTELELKERADVLVSETFGSHPFEECTHEFMKDARERLCKPNARILPSHVSVFAAPATFEDKRLDWDLFARPVGGLDLSRLTQMTRDQMYAEACPADALLAEPALLERVELGGPAKSQRKMQAVWKANRAGVVSGLVQWFEATLSPEVTLSTSPLLPPTHWRQIFYPLPAPIKVKVGETLRAEVRLDTRIDEPLSVTWKMTKG